jgi:WD40 repeat protein
VLAVSFSPDGTQLLSSSQDRTARRWEVATGRLLGETPHDSGVTHGKFQPGGRQFVTASHNRTVQLWSAATGQPVGPALLHPGPVIQLAFSQAGDRLATVTDQGTAHVWDAATGFPVGEPPRSFGPLGAVGFSPDGSRLLVAGADGLVRIFPIPDLPAPMPAWFPDLLDWVAAEAPDPERLNRLRRVIREGDPAAPWNVWARGRLEPPRK